MTGSRPFSRWSRRARLASVILLASAGLILTAVLLADWRLLKNEYHAFRLNRAETWEDAGLHLHALLALAGHPGASEALVAKLGARNQRLTLWVFGHLVETASATPKATLAGMTGQLAQVLPWIREIGKRLDRDPGLLAAWAQFLRWSEACHWPLGSMHFPALRLERPPSISNNAFGFVSAVLAAPFAGDFYETVRKNPEGFEGLLRLWKLELLGLRFILGGPERVRPDDWKPLPPGSALFGHADALREEEAALSAWFSKNRLSLRFDHDLGRFAERESESLPPAEAWARAMALRKEDMRAPAPLPGWKGSLPERSPESAQTILDVEIR